MRTESYNILNLIKGAIVVIREWVIEAEPAFKRLGLMEGLMTMPEEVKPLTEPVVQTVIYHRNRKAVTSFVMAI